VAFAGAAGAVSSAHCARRGRRRFFFGALCAPGPLALFLRRTVRAGAAGAIDSSTSALSRPLLLLVDFFTLYRREADLRLDPLRFVREFRLSCMRFVHVILVSPLFLMLFLAVTVSAAETGWVKGEIRLNLRSGRGTQFKILGSVRTGDLVTVLGTQESWTHVETTDGKIGWIPVGYLESEPPPKLQLQQAETEAASLRTQLEELHSETAGLRESNASLSANDSGQREEIEALKLEYFELRAGSRYQEWVTGALILALGMIVGAVLNRRNSNRRGSTRLRL
jgi:SH3 domain protein